MRRRLLVIALVIASPIALGAQTKPRENDLKLPIGGTPGALDAITDVAGVEVGHTTLISGSGKLVIGKGPVRTGVTVIHPRGKGNSDPVFAAWFTLNGNGEMTGTTWVQESGYLEYHLESDDKPDSAAMDRATSSSRSPQRIQSCGHPTA